MYFRKWPKPKHSVERDKAKHPFLKHSTQKLYHSTKNQIARLVYEFRVPLGVLSQLNANTITDIEGEVFMCEFPLLKTGKPRHALNYTCICCWLLKYYRIWKSAFAISQLFWILH